MATAKELFYEKRGQLLVKNLKSRHFDACYCPDKVSALEKALEWIAEGTTVGWGGTLTAQQIGLLDAIRQGNYKCIDRNSAKTPEKKKQAEYDCITCDTFITSANAVSLDGQMVNIDGIGNRLAAIAFGPKNVLVVIGMNKVEDTLDAAVNRARTIAAPQNQQRFDHNTPCKVTGMCSGCKSLDSICNEILITRLCKPAERIRFIVIGEDLGL
jgi:hypothetical protein